MFSLCSELTPRARIPDTRIPQLMQPWYNAMYLYTMLVHLVQLLQQALLVKSGLTNVRVSQKKLLSECCSSHTVHPLNHLQLATLSTRLGQTWVWKLYFWSFLGPATPNFGFVGFSSILKDTLFWDTLYQIYSYYIFLDIGTRLHKLPHCITVLQIVLPDHFLF